MFNSESNVPHNQVFVPVSDELIFDNPELIEGPLVPYSSGMACHGWLSIELNPEDDVPVASLAHRTANPSKPNPSKPNPSKPNPSKGSGLLHKVGLRGRSGKSKSSNLDSSSHLKLVFGG